MVHAGSGESSARKVIKLAATAGVHMGRFVGLFLRSYLITAVTLVVSPSTTLAEIPVWQDLRQEIETKLDQQLERTGGFDELDASFRSSKPELVQPNLATTSVGADQMPLLVGDFVRFYSGSGRIFYQSAIQRFERYHPMIREVFAREGVPIELAWIGLVESGYNPLARSRRDAVGIWQLIPETAVSYGLAVGPRIDERTDPVKSTLAGARFLRHLYNTFGEWNLVLAAYNSGEQRVSRSIAVGRTSDFWELARRQLLHRETQDYVPAVLAAAFLGGASPGPNKIEVLPSKRWERSSGLWGLDPTDR